MKIKIDSIILFVQDVERLKTFYANVFKFTVIEEIEAEWVLLNCGSCNIGLHQVGEKYTNNGNAKHHNNTKIVFEVDDLFTVSEMLTRQNVQLAEIKTFENYDYWVCDGTDPEGNIFQLKQKK